MNFTGTSVGILLELANGKDEIAMTLETFMKIAKHKKSIFTLLK